MNKIQSGDYEGEELAQLEADAKALDGEITRRIEEAGIPALPVWQ